MSKQSTYNHYTLSQDPLKAILHTLPNGLTLYLSVNKIEPRIFTNIAIRSGSKQDPADTTGLAHYMEHMLFKGTSKIGALDWEKEKALLDKISDLYEEHRSTNDLKRKKEIYKEIDGLSIEAAKYVAPNEYDKLSSAIGANHTNAYTWFDQTVFVNDIPANELERWFQLESERFSMMALRLFHTELETVYEEFNISQDRDVRKSNNAIRASLFPQHPYGTQTTIGRAEHLKNPSQVKIQDYFRTYYVPNNMALIMAGDFDPDTVITLAEKYFGSFPSKPLPPFQKREQPVIDNPIRQVVRGQDAAFVDIAWRFNGSDTDDPLMLSFLSSLMSNGEVGLLDINLNKEQKVLTSEGWSWFYHDYSVFGLYGKPREGQTLEQVEELLLGEIQQLKNGAFDDALLEAIINNYRLQETKDFETNKGRVFTMTDAFVLDVAWDRFVGRYDWYRQLGKPKIVAFAHEYLNSNHVVVYKEQGPDPHIIKVEKPQISSIELNRGKVSTFGQEFLSRTTPNLEPVFVNYTESIKNRILHNGLALDYVKNPLNDLFRLDYIFEMGRLSDLKLPIADYYQSFSGTNKHSPAELSKAFFRLGLSFNIHTYGRKTYVSLKGLDSSMEQGILLLEHLLTEPKEDVVALENVVKDIFTKRENAKQNKNVILRDAMVSFAKMGREGPFRYRLSKEELLDLRPAELTERIRNLCNFEHKVYYYGPRPLDEVATLIEQHHRTPQTFFSPIPPRFFEEFETTNNQVFFVDFPLVQVEVMLISRGTPYFNFPEYLMREWYNEYFGFGLSSIVFQEIREAKALAYSTYAYYSMPKRKDRAHYLSAFVGTQPDKVSDALPALLKILHQMPFVSNQIDNARDSILKQLESERIFPSKQFWEAQTLKDLGYYHDLRRDMYQRLKLSTAEDLALFHRNFVQGRNFKIMVLGDKQRINLNYLEEFGTVSELSIEDLFGY